MAKKRPRDNIYIQALSYANDNTAGFSRMGLLGALDGDIAEKEVIDKYFGWADQNTQAWTQGGQVSVDRFTIFVRISDRDIDQASVPHYVLTSSAYFDYLSYLEINQARQSSNTARGWSVVALVVTLLVAGTNILVQENSTTKIDQAQIRTVVEGEAEVASRVAENSKNQSALMDEVGKLESIVSMMSIDQRTQLVAIAGAITSLAKRK